MDSANFFIFLGSVILIGVFGNFFFDKTRVPNPVILILVGVFLGPLTGIIDVGRLHTITPYFGTLALILILFEGGLELDLREAIAQGRIAALVGVLTYTLSVAGIAIVAIHLLGAEIRAGIMYGLVLAGTSPAIILPILKRMKLTKETTTLFALESVVSEVLTVTLATLFLNVFTTPGTNSIGSQIYYVVHVIWVSILIAVLFGWGWNWALPYIERLGLSHMLTLACLFFMYASSHLLKGEAAITILLFGLILENGHAISSQIKQRIPTRFSFLFEFSQINEKRIFSSIFSEITFLVRTFFFVLMGLTVSFKNTTTAIWASALLIILFFFGVRKGILFLTTKVFSKFTEESGTIGELFISRGLATAVIALTVSEKMPGTESLLPISFLIILGSNILMSFRVRKFI